MADHPDADFIALQQALVGEYSLEREIGRGGMGIVYLAREVNLARPVAIKVLPTALAARPEVREAFLRESRTIGRLTHPNVVPVYAAGERSGFAYLVMAYVEGITLGERIRARGPLLPGQAARVLREVAWALAYAHAAGIVHRDVTAENILLERGTDRAIVMDFGIAGAMQTAALSDDGRVMGNAHYVSPEQAAGDIVDARSDLYSLGICGFYALTGRLPFDAETPEAVVTKHLTERPPSIASLASAVPVRLGQAVDRCLAKEPLARYRSAESFAEAIDLAFEHAKEIPAPLRVWIRQGETGRPARFVLIGIFAWVGIGFAFATTHTMAFFGPVAIATSLGVLPAVLRLRRVLRDGYVTDDLAAALREHQLARSEEVAYELAQRSPMAHRIMRILLGASSASIVLFGGLMAAQPVAPVVAVDIGTQNLLSGAMFGSIGIAAITGIALGGDYLRHRLPARMAALSISFWKSKWARRIAAFVGIGLDHSTRPALGMPLLTEVALGRATDHLFQALPKAMRRELASLPETIRQLETNASNLRASIAVVDEPLATVARSRLAATVAALENIRLDLLRLQTGAGGIESVTASLEAAQRAGEQIEYAVQSRAEVERISRTLTGAIEALAPKHGDHGADTPVHGVPAIHS
ncbi:MAG: serine/threonine-protein kinase [Gemmatimonadaceae bacterium]